MTARLPGPPAPVLTRTRRTLRFGVGPQWSPHQLALAALSTVGAAIYLAALHVVAPGLSALLWLLLLVPATTMSFAGSGLPLAFWGLLLFVWFVQVPTGSFTWWSLPAAAGLLLAHVSTALSATAPPSGSFTAAHFRRRARPAGVALLVTAVVAAVASWLAGHGIPASPAAYVIGLAGIVVGLWLVRTNPPRPRD